MVYWLTGLSGVGKTTVARLLFRQLRAEGLGAVHLDGDEVREAIADTSTSHERESRIRNAYRISRFARLFESQGLTVVVSTMSLYHEIHAWNRANLVEYLEVLLRARPETLTARDPKGIYNRLAQKAESNVVGFDTAVEWPLQPHLILDTDAAHSADDEVAAVRTRALQLYGARSASKGNDSRS